jgi:hypothetical protein
MSTVKQRTNLYVYTDMFTSTWTNPKIFSVYNFNVQQCCQRVCNKGKSFAWALILSESQNIHNPIGNFHFS